ILVNSIHFSAAGDEDDVWRQSFNILFLPAARLTRLVVPHMRSAGGGSIVHLSSVYGREAGGRPGYNVIKAALISHAKAMAFPFADESVPLAPPCPTPRLSPTSASSISHAALQAPSARSSSPNSAGTSSPSSHSPAILFAETAPSPLIAPTVRPARCGFTSAPANGARHSTSRQGLDRAYSSAWSKRRISSSRTIRRE